MNILYLSNCYAPPDEVNVGAAARHYYHVEALRQRGHNVSVVTAAGSTLGGQETMGRSLPEWVFVTDTKALRGSGLFSRLRYYLGNFISTFHTVRRLPERPELVLASVPNILIGLQGWIFAKRWRVPLVIDVRDLWADSLCAGRYGKFRWFVWLNEKLEQFIYRRAEAIYCTTEPQMTEVRKLAPRCNEIEWIPNGIDRSLFERRDENATVPDIQELRTNWHTIVLFAGKHSDYTNLDTVLSAAKLLKGESVAFVLLGGGYQKAGLQERKDREAIENVFFFDPVPKSEVYDWMRGSDILLINYSGGQQWSRVLPNKLYDYLACGKPIIAAVCKGEITRVVIESEAGVCVEPEDPRALAKSVTRLRDAQFDSLKPRQYVFEKFDREQLVAKLSSVIESIGT